MRSADVGERPSSGIWPGLFWTLVEPLMGLMETRARHKHRPLRASVRLPDARSSTSWAVRGVSRPSGAHTAQQNPVRPQE